MPNRNNADQFPCVERVEIEFFGGLISVIGCLVDGEPRVLVSSASDSLGKSTNWIGRVIRRGGDKLKSLKLAGFCGDIKCVSFKNGHGVIDNTAKTLSYSDFEVLVKYLAFTENNETCLKVFGVQNSFDGSVSGKIQKNQVEKKIRDELHSKLGGQREVRTPAGSIDLLTDTHLIEVKDFRGWKSAIGQVQAYGVYYPKHILKIYLFGERTPKMEKTVKTVCQYLKIQLEVGRIS